MITLSLLVCWLAHQVAGEKATVADKYHDLLKDGIDDGGDFVFSIFPKT